MSLVTPELPEYGRSWRGLPIVGWTGIDPASPPIFESETSYLDRHGLLLPTEKRRLSDADFDYLTKHRRAAPKRGTAPRTV